MKHSTFATLLAMTLCVTLSACVDQEATDEADSVSESEQQVVQEVCPAAYGCVLTSIRDNGGALIDTCIAVLCN